MSTKCRYDLNICRPKKYFENVLEAWEGWKEKPESPEIRLGTLSEPTGHPEFLEVLKTIKPYEYLTDGRIFGTPGDPRRSDFLSETIRSGSKVILLWSDTSYCKRAIQELRSSKIDYTLGVRMGTKEFMWKEDENYLLIPEDDKDHDTHSLKNVKIMKYYENILLTDSKIIITKNSTNLKPLKVYDRI